MKTKNKRLIRLETAHRALAARSEAMFQVSKIIFPLIGQMSPEISKRLATSIYDATNEHMARLKFDDEYQRQVRNAMDELCALIVNIDSQCVAR